LGGARRSILGAANRSISVFSKNILRKIYTKRKKHAILSELPKSLLKRASWFQFVE